MEDRENRLAMSLAGAAQDLNEARVAAAGLPWGTEKERMDNGKFYAAVTRLLNKVQQLERKLQKRMNA